MPGTLDCKRLALLLGLSLRGYYTMAVFIMTAPALYDENIVTMIAMTCQMYLIISKL